MPGHTWATSAVEAAGDKEKGNLRVELHSTLLKMKTIWDQH